MKEFEVPSAVRSARHVISSYDAPELEFPAEKRPMGSRRLIPIAAPETAAPTRLSWHDSPVPAPGPMHLRLLIGVDDCSSQHVVISNATTDQKYGAMEILYACPGQVFEHPLTTEQAAAALRDGLSLQLKEGPPLWIVASGPNAPEAILPQLYADGGAPSLEHFLSLFCSTASLQPCDWMETCVLDGLLDWADKGRPDARQAIRDHLRILLDPETGRREDYRSHPCDDQPAGPESSGPFAVLAMLEPEHPALRFADEGFKAGWHPAFDAVAHGILVTESNYNVAYPMMAMALHAGRPALRDRALRQLDATRRYLADDDDLYLRFHPDSKERTFRNWSRGVAWYFLGLVRTLALLPAPERPEALVAETDRMAAWVARHQLENGLWPCFLKETNVSPDSSGSAGIAAAIALGVQQCMVDPALLPNASRCLEGLTKCMTHDGWLRGVSQSNKWETHHMDIQRHPFRVIAPWGMGLFAQLNAALYRLESRRIL